MYNFILFCGMWIAYYQGICGLRCSSLICRRWAIEKSRLAVHHCSCQRPSQGNLYPSVIDVNDLKEQLFLYLWIWTFLFGNAIPVALPYPSRRTPIKFHSEYVWLLAEQSNWIILGNVKQFRIFTPAGISVWKGDEVTWGGNWGYPCTGLMVVQAELGAPFGNASIRPMDIATNRNKAVTFLLSNMLMSRCELVFHRRYSFLFIFNRNQENWEMDSK